MTELQHFFAELGLPLALEPHPRLEVLPEAMLWAMVRNGEEQAVIDWGRERHLEIELEQRDRFRYGWRGDPAKTRALGGGWKRTVDAIAAVKRANPRWIPKVLAMGGNGSSKSEFMAWYAVSQMVQTKGYRVACLCPSEKQAREVMMARMWGNFPIEWRPESTGKLKSGVTGNISYSEKMGFTENLFIFPNGSRCTFYFYEDGDPKSLEGVELDLVVADEEVPLVWLEAAEYRLVRRSGTLLAGFTPISGYGPTVAWFRGNGGALEDREAELCPKFNEAGEVIGLDRLPLLERGADPTKRVVYFWTQDCPYPASNYETLKEELKTKRATLNKIKERAYGVPTKIREAAFPLFNEAAHCIPLREVPAEVTWWMVMDPAHGRNAFVQWWACDKLGRQMLVREWPQQDDYIPGVGQPGPWAVLSTKQRKLDGDRGSAQEGWGLSYEQMKAEIERVERWLGQEVEKRVDGQPVRIFRRILDSRLGNTEVHGATIQSEYAKLGILFDFASGKNLNVTNADSESTAGITLINNALSYHTERPLGPSNFPRLQIVYEPAGEDLDTPPTGCANTVFALKTWTGHDKEHGACKDPVDCTHYFLRDDPRYFEPRSAAGRRGRWGGYGAP